MVKKINAQEFENEAMKAPVAVIDFSATWCGPCKLLAPVVESVSEKLADKACFYNVDVDDASDLAMKYGINSIPCLILLKNGKAVSQSVGFKPEAQVISWIEGNL